MLPRRVPLVEQELSSPPVFSGIRVTRSLGLCVCFVNRFLSFWPFSFGHCVVCSSSIYEFWLPLWYLQNLLWGITHKDKSVQFELPEVRQGGVIEIWNKGILPINTFLLAHEGIIRSVVRVASPKWWSRYIYNWNLFLSNVIINKTKVLLPQSLVTLACLVHLGLLLPKIYNIWLSNLRTWWRRTKL